MSSINLSGSALSSLFSNSSLTEAGQGLQVRQAGTADTGNSEGPGTAAETDQARVSQLGQLMNQLQQLSTTDQDGFQAMAKSISDTLAQSASSSTDVQQQEAWSALSSQFSEAAESGDISSLQAILSVTAGLSSASSASSVGMDTVTLSTEGRALAALDESAGVTASSETEKEADSTESSESDAQEEAGSGTTSSDSSDAAPTTAASSGGSASGGGISGSTEKTESEIEDEIDEKERDIKNAQAKLDQGKQAAQGDDSATNTVKGLQSKLDTLNAELAVLRSEKVQAQ